MSGPGHKRLELNILLTCPDRRRISVENEVGVGRLQKGKISAEKRD